MQSLKYILIFSFVVKVTAASDWRTITCQCIPKSMKNCSSLDETTTEFTCCELGHGGVNSSYHCCNSSTNCLGTGTDKCLMDNRLKINCKLCSDYIDKSTGTNNCVKQCNPKAFTLFDYEVDDPKGREKGVCTNRMKNTTQSAIITFIIVLVMFTGSLGLNCYLLYNRCRLEDINKLLEEERTHFASRDMEISSPSQLDPPGGCSSSDTARASSSKTDVWAESDDKVSYQNIKSPFVQHSSCDVENPDDGDAAFAGLIVKYPQPTDTRPNSGYVDMAGNYTNTNPPSTDSRAATCANLSLTSLAKPQARRNARQRIATFGSMSTTAFDASTSTQETSLDDDAEATSAVFLFDTPIDITPSLPMPDLTAGMSDSLYRVNNLARNAVATSGALSLECGPILQPPPFKDSLHSIRNLVCSSEARPEPAGADDCSSQPDLHLNLPPLPIPFGKRLVPNLSILPQSPKEAEPHSPSSRKDTGFSALLSSGPTSSISKPALASPGSPSYSPSLPAQVAASPSICNPTKLPASDTRSTRIASTVPFNSQAQENVRPRVHPKPNNYKKFENTGMIIGHHKMALAKSPMAGEDV